MGKEKSPVPRLGQDLHPAVPPKLAHSAPSLRVLHTRRHGNGCGSRQRLLRIGRSRSLCPRKSIRRNVLCRDPTIHGSLKGDRTGYSSCSSVYLIALHYTHLRPNCQPEPARNFLAVENAGEPTAPGEEKRRAGKSRRAWKSGAFFPAGVCSRKGERLRTAGACRRPRRCR